MVNILYTTVIAGLKAINSTMVKVQLQIYRGNNIMTMNYNYFRGFFNFQITVSYKFNNLKKIVLFCFRIGSNSNNRERKIIFRKETMQKSFALLVEENAFFLAVMEKPIFFSFLYFLLSIFFLIFQTKRSVGHLVKDYGLKDHRF